MKYFHGGVKNLKIGDDLLPVSITGKPNICQHYTDEQIRQGYGLTDRVYITTDLNAAKTYASVIPLGDVYQIEPIGDLEIDIDAPGISFMCKSAKVVSIIQRRVKFQLKRVHEMFESRESK